MKERILQTLSELRTYALQKGGEVVLYYHEEDSSLMRFANSAISLNTNEHLIRLEIIAYAGRKRASYELITDLSKLAEMKQGLDIALEMVQHAQPLNYPPTIPTYTESFADESACDPALAALTGAEKLQYFNQAAAGLETSEIKLSGIFSSGVNTIAQINTRSPHTQYFQTTDAQVTAVLSHTALKWELTSEQSAQKKSDLDPAVLRRELAFLLDAYQHNAPQQLALGSYDIVFGAIAIAQMVSFLNWIGFSGGMMKRGFSCLKEENLGQKVFSEHFSLRDDPTRPETFPFQRDFSGLPRAPFALFEQGIFRNFTWSQDDADEFSAAPTGHSVAHKSLVLAPGSQPAADLAELVALPRERDLLYIPYLHYMNIVNPSKAIITGSSRFGALLFKQDGTLGVPYNVRLTQSLLDIFGERLAWLSSSSTVHNASSSYGARNPTALIVPSFMRVNNLEISHSNASY